MARTWRTAAAALIASVTGVGLAVVGNIESCRRAPTDLFFSEYVEGSSNNKALEIYNGTGRRVDLAAGGTACRCSSTAATTAALTINLTGRSPPATFRRGPGLGRRGDPGPGRPDQRRRAGSTATTPSCCARARTVLDVIGQVGFDPGTEWGTGLTSTADNTLRRKTAVTAGDTNGADAFDPAVEWDGFATDTFDGLGSHTGRRR